jgi:hypothetical protein
MSAPSIAVLLVEDNAGSGGSTARCAAWRRAILTSSCSILLPDEQGYNTFARTQERAAQTLIIVLTGLEDEALGLKTLGICSNRFQNASCTPPSKWRFTNTVRR